MTIRLPVPVVWAFIVIVFYFAVVALQPTANEYLYNCMIFPHAHYVQGILDPGAPEPWPCDKGGIPW